MLSRTICREAVARHHAFLRFLLVKRAPTTVPGGVSLLDATSGVELTRLDTIAVAIAL